MNDKIERYLEGTGHILMRHYPFGFLEELRKIRRNISQDSRCAGQDSNRAPPEYMSRALRLSEAAPSYCHMITFPNASHSISLDFVSVFDPVSYQMGTGDGKPAGG
jgi:hypothetical protein